QLATFYNNGEKGFPQDFKKAAKWFRKVAENGDVNAQFTLAAYYEKGLGVDKNTLEAMKWYGKAAEGGDEEAEEALKRLEKYVDKVQVDNVQFASPFSTHHKLKERPKKPEQLGANPYEPTSTSTSPSTPTVRANHQTE